MFKCILISLCLGFFLNTSAFAQKPDLLISTWATPPLSKNNQKGYLDQVLIEAFKRIHKNIFIIKKPAERSLKDANEGQSDGDFLRVSGLSRIYPNLIQVPEEIFQIEFVIFSKKEAMTIQSWSDLSKYETGIIIGWKILEENIPKTASRHSLADPYHMFKLLEKQRLDLVVYSKYIGTYISQEKGYNQIHSNTGPPLAIRPMYLYLNKKHKKLIPPLSKSLKQMKIDGTLDKIKQTYLLKQ